MVNSYHRRLLTKKTLLTFGELFFRRLKYGTWFGNSTWLVKRHSQTTLLLFFRICTLYLAFVNLGHAVWWFDVCLGSTIFRKHRKPGNKKFQSLLRISPFEESLMLTVYRSVCTFHEKKNQPKERNLSPHFSSLVFSHYSSLWFRQIPHRQINYKKSLHIPRSRRQNFTQNPLLCVLTNSFSSCTSVLGPLQEPKKLIANSTGAGLVVKW